MLTPDVRFEGWSTEAWSRFLELWRPRAKSDDAEAARPRGGVLAVHDRKRVRKLLHTSRGRLVVPADLAAPPDLAALAEAHHASWALSAEFGALDEVMERFGERARRGDDITAQALKLVQIVREMIDEGAIDTWPRRLRGVPVPTTAMVDRAIDVICPDDRAITLGMFRGGDLWTAFVARRRGTGFDVIAGPDELRPVMGVLSGDWRRDYRHLARAVEETYAPLAFGCFAEVDTFRELQLDGRPGAWSRAVAVRDVILSPVPGAVGLALGFDATRVALGRLEPLFDRARRRLGRITGDRDVTQILGFDPLAALRALLDRQ